MTLSSPGTPYPLQEASKALAGLRHGVFQVPQCLFPEPVEARRARFLTLINNPVPPNPQCCQYTGLV